MRTPILRAITSGPFRVGAFGLFRRLKCVRLTRLKTFSKSGQARIRRLTRGLAIITTNLSYLNEGLYYLNGSFRYSIEDRIGRVALLFSPSISNNEYLRARSNLRVA